MRKEDIQNIYKLIKEKRFDQVYKLYGTNTYLAVTPNKHKKNDIKSLIAEGKFFELYEKYGENVYSKYEKAIMRADVRNELGVKPGFINCALLENIKRKLKVAKTLVFATSLVVAASPVVLTVLSTSVIKESEAKYEDILDEYNNEIDEYAKYINGLGLNDLEVIVKVMNDMWSNIEGYKNPDETYDSIGFNRLALYNDGYGICRNMADDFTARMNAINPKYEACNLNVYISDSRLNNINRTIVDTNETVEDVSNEQVSEPIIDITDIFGNHMVSCITLKDEDTILIVDPTNPSIGVLQNGKIQMLSQAKDGLSIKDIGMTILGIDGYMDYQKKILESFTTNDNLDDLNEKYGIDAQNNALSDIIEKYDEDHYNVRGK